MAGRSAVTDGLAVGMCVLALGAATLAGSAAVAFVLTSPAHGEAEVQWLEKLKASTDFARREFEDCMKRHPTPDLVQAASCKQPPPPGELIGMDHKAAYGAQLMGENPIDDELRAVRRKMKRTAEEHEAQSKLSIGAAIAAAILGAIAYFLLDARSGNPRRAEHPGRLHKIWLACMVLAGLCTLPLTLGAFLAYKDAAAAGTLTRDALVVPALLALASLMQLAVVFPGLFARRALVLKSPELRARRLLADAKGVHAAALASTRSTLAKKKEYLDALKANAGSEALVTQTVAEVDQLQARLQGLAMGDGTATVKAALADLDRSRAFVATVVKNAAPAEERKRAAGAVDAALSGLEAAVVAASAG